LVVAAVTGMRDSFSVFPIGCLAAGGDCAAAVTCIPKPDEALNLTGRRNVINSA